MTENNNSLFVPGKKVFVYVTNNGSSDQDIYYQVVTEDLQKEIIGWYTKHPGWSTECSINTAMMSILKLNLDDEDCPDPHPHSKTFFGFKQTFDFIRDNNLDLVGSQW